MQNLRLKFSTISSSGGKSGGNSCVCGEICIRVISTNLFFLSLLVSINIFGGGLLATHCIEANLGSILSFTEYLL